MSPNPQRMATRTVPTSSSMNLFQRLTCLRILFPERSAAKRIEPGGLAQGADWVKVAEGEYRVAEEGDVGVGPTETEIFHFRESWTLWRVQSGEYEVEGERSFKSPRDFTHIKQFVARLTHNLQLVEVKEFAKPRFQPDSGPLTCEFLPHDLKCSSGAKDAANGVDFNVDSDQPNGLIWPLSAFSLGSLTRAAGQRIGAPVPIQVVQPQEFNDVLPVLPIRSGGFLKYLGQSDAPYVVSNQSRRPSVYELDANPIRNMFIWTSPEGIVLVVQRPGWPKATMELVRFTKFSDF